MGNLAHGAETKNKEKIKTKTDYLRENGRAIVHGGSPGGRSETRPTGGEVGFNCETGSF